MTSEHDFHIPATPELTAGPTIYPTSPPVEEQLDFFWGWGPAFEGVSVNVRPPERPLALLEKLGPSPFPRSGFPVIGFLATTYEKVSRFALERR